MNPMVLLLSLSFLLLIHTYLFYPVSIKMLSLILKKNYKTDINFRPPVSIIISAYNEEKVIENTIWDLYYSDYPQENMEILVGSDCSTDNTDNLLLSLMNKIPNLKFYRFDKRRGKKFVVNDLVKEAKGKVLIFCDSNSRYKKDAIKNLVKYFKDHRVGGVCGRLILKSDYQELQSGNQEKRYWDYETRIKIFEGKLGVLIGSNGAIYSIRKDLFIPMPEKEFVVDDLYITLKILEQNKDFLYTPESEAEEFVSNTVQNEFKRKVRILPRSLETLKKTKSLLFSRRVLVSYCYWSHKVIRWFSPLLLILLLVTNGLVYSYSTVYVVSGLLQVLFYLSGIIGLILNKFNIKILPFEISFYFITTNIAVVAGYWNFILKRHRPVWEPTERR